MNVGLWVTPPALLGGACAILWVTTRLERIVAGPAAVGDEDAAPESADNFSESKPPLLVS